MSKVISWLRSWISTSIVFWSAISVGLDMWNAEVHVRSGVVFALVLWWAALEVWVKSMKAEVSP